MVLSEVRQMPSGLRVPLGGVGHGLREGAMTPRCVMEEPMFVLSLEGRHHRLLMCRSSNPQQDSSNPQMASGDPLRTWDSWDWTLLGPPAPNSPLPFPEGELGI